MPQRKDYRLVRGVGIAERADHEAVEIEQTAPMCEGMVGTVVPVDEVDGITYQTETEHGEEVTFIAANDWRDDEWEQAEAKL